jgi:hypothetical protein
MHGMKKEGDSSATLLYEQGDNFYKPLKVKPIVHPYQIYEGIKNLVDRWGSFLCGKSVGGRSVGISLLKTFH